MPTYPPLWAKFVEPESMADAAAQTLTTGPGGEVQVGAVLDGKDHALAADAADGLNPTKIL